MQKNFKTEFQKFLNMLREGKNFAISRFGDGEFKILEGEPINLLDKANGEFKYQPNTQDELYRKALIASYKYKHPDYYVGIGCPCCVGQQRFELMKVHSEQNEENLTWANIFVNNNYQAFINDFIPELTKKPVVLVAHHKATLDKLPFTPAIFFKIGPNAWRNDYPLIDKIKTIISKHQLKGGIFLFAAGPLANMLAHQLHAHEPENTYLDIGSTLDPLLGLGRHRGYLRGANTLNKICLWN
jgi:hypothetical protein